MNEREAIKALERLLTALERHGVEDPLTRQFFEVGEWLLCFEGIQYHLVNSDVPRSLAGQDYSELFAYFDRWADEWHHDMHRKIAARDA